EKGEAVYPRPFGTVGNIIGTLVQIGGKHPSDYEGPGLLLKRFELEGPIEEWPPPSRHALLGETDLASGSVADAEHILRKFLPRAFRRPVEEAELFAYRDRVGALLLEGRDFESALRWALVAALCAPDFLFLEEPMPGEEKRLDAYAIANRLSYFLWSTMPDEELLSLSASGQLTEPETLRTQVERLLQDPRSKALTTNFAGQWLHLREIDATSPDTKLFPDFDDYLKTSMVRESEIFFETVLHEGKSIREFIDSDWVAINDRLAQHYGIPGVEGSTFQKVSLPADSPRGGIMTQASVLKVTANGANTSPINRGVWILENLLGIHPPPPPPAIPAVSPDVTGAKTLRQLLAVHASDTSCKACHKIIDPPGFALESFDPVGAWREQYRFQGSKQMLPVDSTGETAEGQAFSDIHDYKAILLGEIDQVSYGLTDKLLTYATGRAMGFSDRPEIYEIVEQIGHQDYQLRELIHAVVQSDIFHQP
ncbi:MAG: DUF1592 domain-containing protein, partial [Verrucomicrobiota bacterium]